MLTRAPTRPFASGVLLAKKEKNAKRQGVQAEPRERKQKDDVIEVNGVVTEALPSANFRVEVQVGPTTQTLLLQLGLRKSRVCTGGLLQVQPHDRRRRRWRPLRIHRPELDARTRIA